MSELEFEITDVVVVLKELDDNETAQCVETLKGFGLNVDSIDHDNSIVEGSIPTEKVHELHKFEPVRYVRTVATYIVSGNSPPTNPDDDSD